MNTQNNTLSTGWATFIYAILIIVIILAGWIAPEGLNWIIVGISMFLFIIVMGLNITGRSLGILINERKLMSLSRFQIVLWTVIILSAYFTMVLVRIRSGIPNPLEIEMDWHLWALMGISTTSLVGTPLIQSVKKTKEPDESAYNSYLFSWNNVPGKDNLRLVEFLNRNFSLEWVKTANIEKIDDDMTIKVSSENFYLCMSLKDKKTKVKLNIYDGRTDEFIAKMENGTLNIYYNSKGEVVNKWKETQATVDENREGILYGNKDISDAKFSDMFEGDELWNTEYIDMSKVQMFFFTIIAVLSYVVVLFNMFTNDSEKLKEFPALSEGLIAILAISHGGYLGNKSVDHTKVK